jgi:hypothetical protein
MKERQTHGIVVRLGKTHGKQDLCRAFYFGRTTKFFLKNDASLVRSVEEKKFFVVRLGKNARQTRCLLCVLFGAHHKVFLKKTMLHLFGVWRRKNIFLCVMEKMHDKQDLCPAFYFGRTTKSLFDVLFFRRTETTNQRGGE